MQQGDLHDGDADDFGRSFGDNLRKAREERHISQRQLAEEAARYGVKLDASAITRIERGTREVKLREANAFARSMHLILDDLVDSPEHEPFDRFWRTHSAAMDYAHRARELLAEMAQLLLRAASMVDQHPDVALEVADGPVGRFNGRAFLKMYTPAFPELTPAIALDVDPKIRGLLNKVVVAAAQDVIGEPEVADAET